jgi:hypothetical protein
VTAKNLSFEARTVALARSFPSLAAAPGLDPFDPVAFIAWGDEQDFQARQAAAFVYHVWSFGEAWLRTSPFNAVFAMAVWDDEHRAAFLAWANDPWWSDWGRDIKEWRRKARANDWGNP